MRCGSMSFLSSCVNLSLNLSSATIWQVFHCCRAALQRIKIIWMKLINWRDTAPFFFFWRKCLADQLCTALPSAAAGSQLSSDLQPPSILVYSTSATLTLLAVCFTPPDLPSTNCSSRIQGLTIVFCFLP